MKKLSNLLILIFLITMGCQTEESPTPTIPKSDGTSAKKLSYYTEFFYNQTFGFQTQTKVRYEYNILGKLTQYFVYGFDSNKALVELSNYKFTYTNNHVDEITGFFAGDDIHPIVKYSYEYSPDLYVTKIKEDNYQVGINSEVSLTYDFTLNTVNALYTFSNGQSFNYEFELVNKNIIADKTTKGSELCNTGAYTYDNGINPFSLLGYTDYNLSNVSINNKLTENVDYVNCGFPSLVPESYTYVYDDKGYPISSTTYYKSGGMSRKLFIYK